MDTARYEAGQPLFHDSAGVGMQSTRLGVRLPHLSDFRSIRHNDALSNLEKIKQFGNIFVRIIDAFDAIDSNYVERIGYNFTAMLQATTNYEFYSIGTRNYVERLTFMQHPDLRVGPYFGWKWLFLGYTFDVSNIGTRKTSSSRTELSIYTSMIGVDLIRRSTGNDFFIGRVRGLGDEARSYEGQDCQFIKSRMTGINLYYNFNHRRFSAPAVFSQSAIQRRSAGSWQLGTSITLHRVDFNYNVLPRALLAKTEVNDEYVVLEYLNYNDYSLTGGYAYNWVPAPKWCVGIVLTPMVGYKRASMQTLALHESITASTTDGDPEKVELIPMRKSYINEGTINVGGTGRIGVIYNTGRWFAGLFGIGHMYRYNHKGFRFINTFGTINLCGGFYFQRKKENKADKSNIKAKADISLP